MSDNAIDQLSFRQTVTTSKALPMSNDLIMYPVHNMSSIVLMISFIVIVYFEKTLWMMKTVQI